MATPKAYLIVPVIPVEEYYSEPCVFPWTYCDPGMCRLNFLRLVFMIAIIITGPLALTGAWAENSSGTCQIPQAAMTLWDRPDPDLFHYSLAGLQATAAFAVMGVIFAYAAVLFLLVIFHNNCQQNTEGRYTFHLVNKQDEHMEKILLAILSAALASCCLSTLCWLAFGHVGITDTKNNCQVDLKMVNGGYHIFCVLIGMISGLMCSIGVFFYSKKS